LASGQTFIDDWYITCYNLLFTAFPLCVMAVTDTDIDLTDGKFIKKNLALLYKENRDTHKIFSFLGFLFTIGKGIIVSLVIYSNCCFNEILSIKGQYSSIWYFSLKNYICVLIVVSLNLVIQSHFIVFFQPITIGITTFFLFIIFLILNHYGFLFEFNSKASIFPSLSSPLMYFSIILITCFSLVFDYTFKLINLIRNKNLSYWVFISRSINGKKSISININKAHSLKAARKQLTKGNSKRYSLPYQEISRNYLLKQPAFLMNKIDIRQITTPKNNNYQYNLNSASKN
jgi:magnesium-transporting ATPase (P-type)